MTRKQRIASIAFASILLLSVITVTYAFFTASPNAQISSYVTVNSGSLQLRIDDSTGYQGKVEVTKVDPSHLTLDRYFEITNTGTVDAYAKIYWHDLVNSYLPGSLKYTLFESKNNGSTYTEVITNRNVPRNASTPKDTKLSNDLLIPKNNTTYKYKLTIRYDYKDNYDQTRDINASFVSGFTIINGKEITADTVNPSDIPANHLMERPLSDTQRGKVFNSELKYVEIASLTIETTNIVPANAVGSFDVTASGGTAGAVMAWYTSCESTPTNWLQTNCYDLHIGQEGGVIAPNDSTVLLFRITRKTINVDNLKTQYVTNMSGMFASNETVTNLDLSHFDTSNVTNMSYIFQGCQGLTTVNMNNWDTSHVTTMAGMFADCWSLTTANVSNWDTSNVTTMEAMFASCKGLTTLDIGNWDTSNVTSMYDMFEDCNNLLTLDASNWDTSNVTNMSCMFAECTNLTTLDINNWDTSNVTDMSYMFTACSSLIILDLSNWNTSSATNMNQIFLLCTNLTRLDLSSFDLSKLTTSASVQSMFAACSALTELTTPAVMSPQTIALPKALYASNGTSYASLTSTTPVKTVLKTSWT